MPLSLSLTPTLWCSYVHIAFISLFSYRVLFCLFVGNFVEHEVDLAMFVHLTDKDLVENLGISAFGARKRLLLAIKELTRPTSSIFSAAPGAERRPSAGW